jgi:trigger factor
MQVKELKQDGLEHEFEVTINAKDIDKRVEIKLQEYSKTVRIQGFRAGKVPLNVMKQRYGKAIMGEVLEAAVNETSAKVMKEKSLKPAMQPKIEVKSFDADQDLVYTMNVEVLPEIKIADFKGLKLEKPVAEVGDDTVNDSLKNIAEANTSTKKVESDRKTKNGDTVKMDFDGRTADDNVHQPGMKAEGHFLKLGSGQFIPGFEDQLVGVKAGDKVEVKVTFPENYGAHELAGRDAIFDVVVHEIHEDAGAEINDALAERLGLENLDKLKAAVKEQLQADYDRQSRMVLKKALLDALDETHTFKVPQGMLEAEYNNILDQVKWDRQQREGADADASLSKAEEKEYHEIAERRVRLGLVLSEIGVSNKITVADTELQQAVIREAQKYPGQEREVFDYFSKNRQALESLRAPLFEEKTVDFILELASVKEKKVSIEELAHALDDDDDHNHDCGDESCSHESHKKPAAKKKAAAKKTDDKPAAKKAPAKKAAAKK